MPEPPTAPVHVDVDCSPCLNLALVRAGAPLVERVTLRHDGEQALDGLRLRVQLVDGPVAPFEVEVPALQPGAGWRLEHPALVLDAEAVGAVEAPRSLALVVELYAGDALVGRAGRTLAWTPAARWPGLTGLPETLAAWIRPADPALAALAEADPADDASESARAQRLLESACAALAGRGLRFGPLPAGWLDEGLDVSTPEALLARGQGTPLDAALLLAGLLERAGLRALVVLCRGAVLAGCRTQPTLSPPAAFDDDAAAWQRRVQRGEALLLDPSALADADADLTRARAKAAEVVRDPAALRGVLDVSAARAQGVAPLWNGAAGGDAGEAPGAHDEPVRGGEVDQRLDRWKRRLLDLSLRNRLLNVRETKKTLPLQVHDLGALEDVLADGRALSVRPALEAPEPRPEPAVEPGPRTDRDTDHGGPTGPAPETDSDRAPGEPGEPEPVADAGSAAAGEPADDAAPAAAEGDARDPASAAPTDAPPTPGSTQTVLAFDEAGRIYEKPEPAADEGLPAGDASVTDEAHALPAQPSPEPGDPLDAALAAALKRRRLHAAVGPGELDKRLLELSRAARLSLEETGANTLALVLGFLAWREHDDDTLRRAPILLLPLHLEREGRTNFRIVQADEDPRLNVTLIEKLRAEHGLELPLTELPEDETGVDVHGVLDAVRAAIAEQDGWEVVEEAWLGLFSFTKFMMWRDLEDRSDSLLRHDVVRHLIERPDDAFHPETTFPDPARLDEQRHPREVLCPLDADSSQLAAVLAAQEGCSFRLEGPPGTGKSQTITNLIAQCLALGKRVLFVAEKRAALEVVHSRLTQVGLGPFCMELHSNKTSKRAVLDQLREALEVVRREPPAQWEVRAERLADLRRELNAYVETLHRPGGFGLSVRDATARLARLHDVPRHELGRLDVDRVDADGLTRLEELLDRLRTARDVIGAPLEHDLAGFARTTWETSLAERLRQCVQAARDALHERDARLAELLPALGLEAHGGAADAPVASGTHDAPGSATADEAGGGSSDTGATGASRAELTAFARLAAALQSAPAVGPAFLGEGGWPARRIELAAWIDATDDVQRRLAKLTERWDERLLERDLDGLLGRWRKAAAAFLPLRWWGQRGVRNELAELWTAGGKPGGERLGEDLDVARRLRDDRVAARQRRDEAAGSLNLPAPGTPVDAEALRAALAWGDDVHGLLPELAGDDAERLARLRAQLTLLVTERRDGLGAPSGLGGSLGGLVTAQRTLDDRVEQLLALAGTDAHELLGGEREPGASARLSARLDAWERGRDALRDWCHWRGLRDESVDAGLRPLVLAFEAGELPDGRLADVFRRSLLETWLEARIDEDERLRSFRGNEHERKMRRFAELDRELMELAGEHGQATLAARVPEASDVTSPHSELGLLERELRKKRRHLPVRRLFERLPHLLPRLKPCVLMSPLSAAQYLDAGETPFDVVVFDEASQIPVWDAVGAIARGSQVVVVGDSRQLPPTSFFQKLEDEDDPLDDEYEELESLLDECAAAGLPHLDLRWHYRSRHESLIAFSNAHYYNNQLVTFPSAHERRDGLGVALRRVDGVYDKGRTRTNRAEAEALVADVVRRLGSDEAPRSLGIVTFSLAQQQLVEELLEAARREHGGLDERLDTSLDEAVFVKNLENVQGDERDVILLGVGYGPDERGKLSMNFGPLNRDGGERRLNVAVTRAREELVVFASFDPEQIDLSRTRAEGVRHLKTFLEYAARGPAAMAERVAGGGVGGDDRDAPLAEAVAARLREHDIPVQRDVGCSASRVDLALGEADGGARLGVLLDGAGWARAHTARDRDRLRPEVLSRLGWRLHRLWSAEWWLQPERELARLLAAWEAARDDRPAPEPDDDTDDDTDDDDHDRDEGEQDPDRGDPPEDGSDDDGPGGGGGVGGGGRGADPTDDPQDPVAVAAPVMGDAPSRGPASEGSAPPRTDADDSRAGHDEERDADHPRDGAGDERDAGVASARASGAASSTSRAAPAAVAEPADVLREPWKPARDRTQASADRFHEARGKKPIERRLLAVVEAEGPLPEDALVRRVAEAFELDRVTAKVRDRVREVWQGLDTDQRPVERDGFVWPAGLEPHAWRVYRPAADGERRLEDVCDEELANCAQAVLADNVSLPAEALAREVARLFGVQRVGAAALDQALRGVHALVARGGAVGEGETVRVA